MGFIRGVAMKKKDKSAKLKEKSIRSKEKTTTLKTW